jgi:hypothetical protein
VQDGQNVRGHLGRLAALLGGEQPELRVRLVDAAAGASRDQPGGAFHQEIRVRLGTGHGGFELGQPLQVVLL